MLVAAGHFHSILSTSIGEVWGCGFNKEGQLGLGHRINIFRAERIEHPATLVHPVMPLRLAIKVPNASLCSD